MDKYLVADTTMVLAGSSTFVASLFFLVHVSPSGHVPMCIVDRGSHLVMLTWLERNDIIRKVIQA